MDFICIILTFSDDVRMRLTASRFLIKDIITPVTTLSVTLTTTFPAMIMKGFVNGRWF